MRIFIPFIGALILPPQFSYGKLNLGWNAVVRSNTMQKPVSIGLARMHKEPGERRDFLPSFVSRLEKYEANVVLEYGYGAGMDFLEGDYRQIAPSIRFANRSEVYQQDFVLVLRYPDDEDVSLMRPGSCLITMAHYPTRPQRVAFLRKLGIEVISLDSIKDDTGRRLVENLKAVAWNGIEAAFRVLRSTYPDPGFGSPNRPPIQVTLIGAGAVGAQVVPAAIRYGDEGMRERFSSAGIPGVIVTTIDYDITPHEAVMRELLSRTDMLIDATQRSDPGKPVIPNKWVGYLPKHAVLVDLSVDPYDCEGNAISIKGIEGIPQGNLDRYIFPPDDPAFDNLPECVSATNRRYSVSCYSWPGIYPKKCMDLYGRQLRPIMHIAIEKGDPANIEPEGTFFERAIARGMLSRWKNDHDLSRSPGKEKTTPQDGA
jgi:alanine dehydrogenase